MKSFNLPADRFKAIVSAYGADPKRWPEGERDAALRFLARNTAKATAWIEDARAVDLLLDVGSEAVDTTAAEARAIDGWEAFAATQPQAAAAAMDTNIVTFPNIAGLPRQNAVHGARKRKPVLPLIWTGIGLAACLAGAGVGVKVTMSSMDDVRAQSVLEQAQLDAEN